MCAGLPSLLVDRLPKQEIYNREYIVNSGCALPITNKTLSIELNKVINNPELYQQMLNNCIKTRKLGAIDCMYNVLKNVPQANYENIQPFALTKHQVIKKVNKTRKELIKADKSKK